jgi:hypothetical protein
MQRDSSRALQHAARHAAMCEWARRGSHTGTHTALLLLASKRDELAAMLPVVREIFELHASATAQALDRWCVVAVVATSGACCSLPASPPDRHAHARRTASASHAHARTRACVCRLTPDGFAQLIALVATNAVGCRCARLGLGLGIGRAAPTRRCVALPPSGGRPCTRPPARCGSPPPICSGGADVVVPSAKC